MALIKNRFAAMFLAASLLGTTIGSATIANARPDDRRVYDSEHKDYHNWNKDEDQQWHVYLTNQHVKYHDFSKANKKEQADYWNWRHDNDHGH